MREESTMQHHTYNHATSHLHDVLLGIHQGALHGHGDLTASLAANAHKAVLVSNNGGAAEAHNLATLDDLLTCMAKVQGIRVGI